MLAPESYEKAKQKALLHLQVELDPISQNIEEWNEKFPISGKIVRIFRGSRICRLGQFINFDVSVCDRGASVRPSGILWLSYSNLVSKKYLEVYLDGKPPNFSVALFQNQSIKAPTQYPVIISPRRKWWHKPLWILENLLHKISGCLYEIKWRIYEILYKIGR